MKDEHTMNQSQSTSLPTTAYSGRLDHTIQNKIQGLLRSHRHTNARSITELLQQIETTTTPRQLNKRINKLQSNIWNLPRQEQTLFLDRLANILAVHILQSRQRALRIEAAGFTPDDDYFHLAPGGTRTIRLRPARDTGAPADDAATPGPRGSVRALNSTAAARIEVR